MLNANDYEKKISKKKQEIRKEEQKNPQSDRIDELYEEIGELAEKRDKEKQKGNVDLFDPSEGIF